MKLLAFWIITIVYVQHAIGVYMENSSYKDIVVEISDSVPVQECSSILKQLEVRIFSSKFLLLYSQVKSKCEKGLGSIILLNSPLTHGIISCLRFRNINLWLSKNFFQRNNIMHKQKTYRNISRNEYANEAPFIAKYT